MEQIKIKLNEEYNKESCIWIESCVEPSLYVIDFAMSKGIHKIMNYMYVRDEYRLQLM